MIEQISSEVRVNIKIKIRMKNFIKEQLDFQAALTACAFANDQSPPLARGKGICSLWRLMERCSDWKTADTVQCEIIIPRKQDF